MQSAIRGVVAILGFGVDGQGVAAWLKTQPAVKSIVFFDDAAESREFKKGTTLDGIDLLFRSPGFPLTHPLMSDAKQRGIPITSSTREVLKNFPGVTVGITGSNGKTTCTALIEEFLKAEFGKERVERGGNDGVPRLDLMGPPFDTPGRVMLSSPERSEGRIEAHGGQATQGDTLYLVLELSSFQLMDSEYSPNVAVVLNITPNHLDWHKDMAEYAEAKRQIVAHQNSFSRASPERDAQHRVEGRVERRLSGDIAILNQEDEIVKTFADGIESKVHWFTDGIPWDQVRVKSHPDTIRAAVTAARALNVSEENILKVLREFPGVPHRLEFIRELDGVKYYNDSSCTTPESAIVACKVFLKGKLILLLGGRDKKMDFAGLYEVIQEYGVRVVPYGEMGATFAKNIPSDLLIENADPMNFEKTIKNARTAAHAGDNIVLSPACASFDMFKNAKERGKEFVDIVRKM